MIKFNKSGAFHQVTWVSKCLLIKAWYVSALGALGNMQSCVLAHGVLWVAGSPKILDLGTGTVNLPHKSCGCKGPYSSPYMSVLYKYPLILATSLSMFLISLALYSARLCLHMSRSPVATCEVKLSCATYLSMFSSLGGITSCRIHKFSFSMGMSHPTRESGCVDNAKHRMLSWRTRSGSTNACTRYMCMIVIGEYCVLFASYIHSQWANIIQVKSWIIMDA